MEKDPTLIPQGSFCYRLEKLREDEFLEDDVTRFGKDLREFSYHHGQKQILCPYFQYTDHGTVRCSYLDTEVVDEWSDGAKEKILAHFGVTEVPGHIGYSWALSDEIKICGINEEEPGFEEEPC